MANAPISPTDAQKLALLQSLGGVGCWEYDPGPRCMALDEASRMLLLRVLGTARQRATGVSLLDLASQAQRRRLQLALDQSLNMGQAFQLELRLRGALGRTVYLQVRGTPASDPATKLVGTFQDISEFKTAQLEREHVITQMQALLDALPQGVSVIDRDLRLLLWNRRLPEILDFPQRLMYRYAQFEQFIRYNALRGEYGPGDAEVQVRAAVERARTFQAHRFERVNSQGRTLLVEGFPFTFGGEVAGFVTTYTDVSERRRADEALVHQRDVLKTIIDHFPGGVSLFDADLQLAAYNTQLKSLLDFPDQLFEKERVPFEDLLRFNAQRGEYGPGDVEALVAASMARARNFQAHRIERQRPDGRWLEITGTPIPSGGFVTTYVDVSERKRAEERIRVLALEDTLTGLPNRLSLNEQLELALDRARVSTLGFAVLFLDLDGFKAVNDQFGHDVGDALLVAVSAVLRAAVHPTDVVARLGGDEFVVLLKDVRERASVNAVAQRIVDGVSAIHAVRDHTIQVGSSIGIALFPDHGETREALLKAADAAMYSVKSRGKNGFGLAGDP